MPTAGSLVEMASATRAKFNAITTKNDNTIYFVTEPDGSRTLYLGNILVNEHLASLDYYKTANPSAGTSTITLASAYRNFKVLIITVYDATITFSSTFVINNCDTSSQNFAFSMIEPSSQQPMSNPLGVYTYNKTTGVVALSETNWGVSQRPVIHEIGVIY